MKNYPNQAAKFDRLRNTLATIADLNARGKNVLDDGLLGYELARRGFYTFRYLEFTSATAEAIEARIVEEKRKSQGSQGARTNARELRRTLQDMGWVDMSGAVTEKGRELLSTGPGSQEERGLLADGLMSIAIPDEDPSRISHPVAVLLKLLNSRPSHRRRGLELALESRDDSDAETQRVLGIYAQELPDGQLRALVGITESQQANAVKVFPPLAKYAGLVTEDLQGYLHIAPSGLERIGLGTQAVVTTTATSDESEPRGTAVSATQRSRRNIAPGIARKSGEVGRARGREIPAALTPDQQAEAQNRLSERTDAHQELVRYFASRIGDQVGTLYEGAASYDLVWRKSQEQCHLFEMKSIDSDADAQIVRAVGQLFYYERFHVRAEFPGAANTKSIVVDNGVPEDLSGFVEDLGIGLILAKLDQGLEGLNGKGLGVLAELPPSESSTEPAKHTPA